VTVDERDWLAERFEAQRSQLRAVAYRMLGSAAEAEDAVQEAWLRVSRSDPGEVRNLAGWLTTIVSRVCLNMLQSRRSRREDPIDAHPSPPVAHPDHGGDPEHEAVQADSVGLALLVVLDTLAPAERLAFVLHDMFAVPFDDIARILDRSPAAVRQLASRGRRRVQGVEPEGGADAARQRRVVDAFLAASRGGDFAALVGLLHPEATFRPDDAGLRTGAAAALGAAAVAETFSGRAQAARLALVDGLAGVVWAPGGTPRVVFRFTVTDGRIAAIDLLADPAAVEALDVEFLDG
jgi:RNA polymerase sigma factor (sigma-70 family)